MLFIIINNNIYEVSNFIKNHPGEGILNEYIANYHNKDVTDEFDRFHFTNESDEILLQSRTNGIHLGIYFVGPSFWKKKIPIYYHFFINPIVDGKNFLSQQKNMTFIISNHTDNSILLFYKNNIVIHEIITYDHNVKKWNLLFENEIYIEDSFDVIIHKTMIENSFSFLSNKKK